MAKRNPNTAIIGIYKIVSPSGRVYIGQSWDIKERFSGYRRKEHKRQRVLYFSFQKYGVAAHQFSVIHRLPPDTSQRVMDRLECRYIRRYRENGVSLLNCREGGAGGGTLSEESRRRVSEALKGRIPWNKGQKGLVKMSAETRERMSCARKGKPSPLRGVKRDPEIMRRIHSAARGQKRTTEQRRRMSERMTGHPSNRLGGLQNRGRKHTAEHRAKLRASLERSGAKKGENHSLAKLTEAQVVEIRSKFIPRKYTARRIAREYGISKTNVLDIIHRKTWTRI